LLSVLDIFFKKTALKLRGGKTNTSQRNKKIEQYGDIATHRMFFLFNFEPKFLKLKNYKQTLSGAI